MQFIYHFLESFRVLFDVLLQWPIIHLLIVISELEPENNHVQFRSQIAIPSFPKPCKIDYCINYIVYSPNAFMLNMDGSQQTGGTRSSF